MTNTRKFLAKVSDVKVVLVCKNCGMRHYDMPRVCVSCQSKPNVDEPFTRGRYVSSIENLKAALDNVVIQSVNVAPSLEVFLESNVFIESNG